MIQVDTEAKRQKANIERSKSITEWKILPRIDVEDKFTYSSMSIYGIDFDDEGIEYVSCQTSSTVRKITPPPMNDEEINNLLITDKIPSERYCSINSIILKEEHTSSFNIEEIFGCFTFDLHRREVSWKKFRKVK